MAKDHVEDIEVHEHMPRNLSEVELVSRDEYKDFRGGIRDDFKEFRRDMRREMFVLFGIAAPLGALVTGALQSQLKSGATVAMAVAHQLF